MKAKLDKSRRTAKTTDNGAPADQSQAAKAHSSVSLPPPQPNPRERTRMSFARLLCAIARGQIVTECPQGYWPLRRRTDRHIGTLVNPVTKALFGESANHHDVCEAEAEETQVLMGLNRYSKEESDNALKSRATKEQRRDLLLDLATHGLIAEFPQIMTPTAPCATIRRGDWIVVWTGLPSDEPVMLLFPDETHPARTFYNDVLAALRTEDGNIPDDHLPELLVGQTLEGQVTSPIIRALTRIPAKLDAAIGVIFPPYEEMLRQGRLVVSARAIHEWRRSTAPVEVERVLSQVNEMQEQARFVNRLNVHLIKETLMPNKERASVALKRGWNLVRGDIDGLRNQIREEMRQNRAEEAELLKERITIRARMAGVPPAVALQAAGLGERDFTFPDEMLESMHDLGAGGRCSVGCG